ncbi:MAG: PH domain-containing protein [Anaerolineaceae bacterium]
MNGEQVFRLPTKKAVLNILILCLLLGGLSTGSILIAVSMQNAGYRILGYIFSILFSLPIFFFLFQLFQIARSKYKIDRDGLTVFWGLQKMVIPIQEIEWIRPYDQMGYTIPLPSLEKIGILSGRIFFGDLGDIFFFATSQQNAFLIGTSQEVLFLSPADAEAFQKGIQEAVYLGSITPLERKSIQIESPVNTVRSNPALYLPIGIGIFLTLVLFVLFGFVINIKDSIRVGLVLFEPASGVIILPIITAIFNIINAIFAPRILKNEQLKLYAYLLAYAGPVVSFFLILSIVLGMLQ